MTGRHRRRGGFTLIEINLAIMLLAVGLLTLISLFPLGLRQADDAYRDAQAALFANYILTGMRRNAEAIDSWAQWGEPAAAFQSRVLNNVLVDDRPAGGSYHASIRRVEFPEGSDNEVLYRMRWVPSNQIPGLYQSPALREVDVFVWGLRDGPRTVTAFETRARQFRTSFYFAGAAP